MSAAEMIADLAEFAAFEDAQQNSLTLSTVLYAAERVGCECGRCAPRATTNNSGTTCRTTLVR